MEAVTWSFVSKAEADLFGGGQAELALSNPIASDLSDMRPSLLPGLIRAAQSNADRGFGDVTLFEVGQVFAGDRPQDQTISATGLRRGSARPSGAGRHWSGAADILKVAQGVDKKLITGASVFDVYEGAGIDGAKKSVAIEVTLQPRERTLTDAEIEAVAGKIVAEVGKKTGAVLRA